MPNSKKPNAVVAFAKEHRNAILPTFDASTALFRARNLLEDVEHLSKIYEAAGTIAGRGRSTGLEITNYYVAGYVTCLEWHARSRRADLLNFMPELIQPGMMKNMEAISQMLSAKVTLADLIGASTKVNNLEDYVDVFNEIWRALNIQSPLKPLLANSAKLGGQDSSLYDLFVRRHALVHEIGIAQVGSYILRDMWTFEEAADHGRMVVDLIANIEKQISKFVPDTFPNKLDDSGIPLDGRDILEKRIEDVERRIAPAMEASGDDLSNSKTSWALHFDVQANFVGSALVEVPKRHYDPTPKLLEMLYRQRLEFLSAIADELGV